MWQILRKLLPQKYVVQIDQSFNLINLSFNSKLKGHLPKQEDNTINFYSFIPIPSEKNEAFFFLCLTLQVKKLMKSYKKYIYKKLSQLFPTCENGRLASVSFISILKLLVSITQLKTKI